MNTSDEYADELASKEEAAKRKGPYSAVNCDGVCVCVCERERERERERSLKWENSTITEGKTKP